MKKIIAFIVMLALIMTCTGGCNKAPAGDSSVIEEETQPDENSLRVLFDLAITGSPVTSEGDRDRSLEEFKEAIEENGGPKDMAFEFMFYQYRGDVSGENSSLRDADLTRVRTEIMAGKGPDVFITACQNIMSSTYGDPLFKYPDQVMKRHTFLTLDGYIENARFMEWDKLTPVVMEAGRTDEGQQVLPLTYTLPMTVCRQSDVELEHSKTLTFFDMADGLSPTPMFSAKERTASTGRTIIMDWGQEAGIFSKVADYSNDTLAFSEDDLFEVMKKLKELEASDKEMKDVPDFFYSTLGVRFISPYAKYDTESLELNGGIKDGEALRLIPVYSVEGGYGALITSFAAINRNTKRPDDAFFVLDYLLSKECQQSSVYMNATVQNSIPTHEEIMFGRSGEVVSNTRKTPNSNTGKLEWNRWKLGKSTFEELCSLRDNISSARFRTELDGKLMSLLEKSKYISGDGESAKQEVHKAYMEMQMMLAES